MQIAARAPDESVRSKASSSADRIHGEQGAAADDPLPLAGPLWVGVGVGAWCLQWPHLACRPPPMQPFLQSLARHPAAALRLACAVLVALWALSATPQPAPGAPSLTRSTHEHSVLAAKRPVTAIAEIAKSRPGKGKVGSPDFPGLVGASRLQGVFAPGVAAFDPRQGPPCEPRSANLARAPPLSAAA